MNAFVFSTTGQKVIVKRYSLVTNADSPVDTLVLIFLSILVALEAYPCKIVAWYSSGKLPNTLKVLARNAAPT